MREGAYEELGERKIRKALAIFGKLYQIAGI